MDAVTDEHQYARGMIAVVVMRRATLCDVVMGVPPQHELLDDEEKPQPDHEREPDRMRAGRPRALHRLR